ncbi:MAG: GTPase Era [Egibacteraceae bacterium]
MRSGFCSIVGRPNVGKSTLLNALVGQKIAITTPVPQTTRHALRGVLHGDGVQVVFVDTPGLHKPKTLLGNRLNDVARGALAHVDLVVFVVDGAAGLGRGDAFVAGLLRDAHAPVIAVLNKVDGFSRARQLPRLEQLAGLGEWDEIVPVSATQGEGVGTLSALIQARMPDGPPYFPPEQVSDQPIEVVLAELIREQAIVRMREEVPHSVAVVVNEISPGASEGVQVVDATVYVERDSQKGIVIGRGGGVLKEIGAQARPGLETLLGTRVYLELRVKLMKEWQRDPKALQRLGY